MSKLILVVDDAAEIRETIGELLFAEGFSTVLTTDGRSALQWLQAGLQADLILLDLMMPRMDGFAFREEQLRDPGIAAIPVVVMTALSSFDAKSLGVECILRKPFGAEELLAALNAAFSGK